MQTGQKLSTYPKSAEISPCEIQSLLDYDRRQCAESSYLKYSIKVAVGPKRSTNRNLKQIITIDCTKTVIFQLLRPLDISKLAKRELIQ